MKLAKYLIGLASGLTFGMLFAPKKGKQLRSAIAKKSKSGDTEGAIKLLGNAYKSAWDDISGEIKGLKDSEQVGAAFELFQGKLASLLDIAEERGGEVAEVAQEKMEAIAGLAKKKAKKVKKTATKKVKKTVKKAKATVKKKTPKVVKKAVKKVTKRK